MALLYISTSKTVVWLTAIPNQAIKPVIPVMFSNHI
ncbi:Uncharacterised protein [Citrobacter koseri]|nr:Uncharacterised protein [Citrobacter koseri]STT21294.1 Uncharacterised protein [Citrobacter koseri]